MGCRESKLDVVAGNTITHASRKSKHEAKRCVPPEMPPEDKSSRLVEAVAVAAALAAAEGRETGILVTTIGKEGETKKLDRKKTDAQQVEEIEKSVCRESPNHFFSPRKEEESADFISAEERSEYSSPPHEPASFKEIRMEDTVEEGRAERERIQEEEPKNQEEENLMKDPQAMTPPEILGIEEKMRKLDEKSFTDSSKEDQSTKQE